MVNGTPKTRLHRLLHYPFVTFSLYIPRFLGLNMIEPPKLLIDSRLAVFLFADSNKTAPKEMKNAPIFGSGQVKINILPFRHHDVGAKVSIFFETTKPPRSSLTVAAP